MNRNLLRFAAVASLFAISHGGPCHGQLLLRVDQLTGGMQIVNSPEFSTGPIEFDGYQIESPSGSLDATGWLSLASQGFSQWDPIGASSNHQIGELSLVGSSVLDLGGAFFLGSAFQSLGIPDLAFQYTGPQIPGGVSTGFVEYVGGPIGLAGDFNADGLVSHADYSVLGDGWGTFFTVEDFQTYRANFGQVDAASLPSSSALHTGILPMSVAPIATPEGNTQWTISFLGVESVLAGHLNIQSDGASVISAAGGETFLDDGIEPVGVPGVTATGSIAEGISFSGTSAFAALGSTLGAPPLGPTRQFLTLLTEGTQPTTLTIQGEYGYQGIDYNINLSASFGPPGSTPDNPILPGEVNPGEFVFDDVASGNWFDPPLVPGFEYIMESASLFTSILDFPPGFAAPFEVLAEGQTLGMFEPGQSVDFVGLLGHGVEWFVVRGISPMVDAEDPTAFPLKIAFNTDFASFRMVAIPEPGTLVLMALGLAHLLLRRRR